jgi:FtsZ-binding cell division protein ZapB
MSPTVTFQNKVRMLKEQTTKLAQEIRTLTNQHNELKAKYQQLEIAYREALHNSQSQSLVSLNSASAPVSVSSPPTSNEEI